jgi:hypothetical protein
MQVAAGQGQWPELMTTLLRGQLNSLAKKKKKKKVGRQRERCQVCLHTALLDGEAAPAGCCVQPFLGTIFVPRASSTCRVRQLCLLLIIPPISPTPQILLAQLVYLQPDGKITFCLMITQAPLHGLEDVNLPITKSPSGKKEILEKVCFCHCPSNLSQCWHWNGASPNILIPSN